MTENASRALKGPIQRPKPLRSRELWLLIGAGAVTLTAACLAQLGAEGRLDPGYLGWLGLIGLLTLSLHVALRRVAPQADPYLLPVASTLNGLGLVMIDRIDQALGDSGFAGAGVRQVAWSALALGLALGVLVGVRNHRALFRYTYLSGLIALLLLLSPLIPGLGRRINGAQVWLALGPLSFQPGEIAKIALAIFFAGYLVRAKDTLALVGRRIWGIQLPRGRDLGPLLVMWAASMAVIVFQRDLGTALLYFGMFLVMLYVATGRFSWVAIGTLLFGGGAALAASALSYVHERFANWLNAFDDTLYNAPGGSYQVVQGLFGLGHGGLIGTGWGLGRPDLTPVAQSDYIIASLGEELGLAGVFAILVLYMVFVARGFRIGLVGHDDFGRLLSVGLSFTFALQVFIVVGGVTRIIPLTGLTTPFLAAGGSSLVANWIIVAVLLRLSDSIAARSRLVIE